MLNKGRFLGKGGVECIEVLIKEGVKVEDVEEERYRGGKVLRKSGVV